MTSAHRRNEFLREQAVDILAQQVDLGEAPAVEEPAQQQQVQHYAALMYDDEGQRIAVGEHHNEASAARSADWLEQNGYGVNGGALVIIPDPDRYLVAADRAKYRSTIHRHRIAEDRRCAVPPCPPDRDPGPADLAEGRTVQRYAEPGRRAAELITSVPCCGRTVRITPAEHYAVCCACRKLFTLKLYEEYDGGHLALFTVALPVAVTVHRNPL